MKRWAAAWILMPTLGSGLCFAQMAPLDTNTEASKEAENPVTRRITVPLRYQADFDDGPYNATKDTFELDQAVLPFTLNDD